jgi:DNA polymerase-3 subunit beta
LPPASSATFEIGARDLKRLIDKTRFAISTEETRYYLNGIYLHTAQRGKEQTLRAVATDGHRLAQAELPAPKGAVGMPGIILPRKTVHELQRLIEGSEGKVTVGVSPAKARFEIGTITLTSKLIDGTFPDYARVIPKANDKKLKVANAEFINAVDRVSTIASERGRAVKLNTAAAAGAVRQQPRAAAPPRRSRSTTAPRRSRSASTRAISSTSPASSRARKRASCWPIRARPP